MTVIQIIHSQADAKFYLQCMDKDECYLISISESQVSELTSMNALKVLHITGINKMNFKMIEQ